MPNRSSTWRQFLDVPPEIWGMVAKLSCRQTILHLCSVSFRFYSIFNPLLYGMTTIPPLSISQSTLLARTLSERQNQVALRGPRPAMLVRSINVLLDWSRGQEQIQKWHAALRNIGGPGSALRRLEWNMSDRLDLLDQVLEYFPNLKEISVKCDDCENISFNVSLVAFLAFGPTLIIYHKWGSSWNQLNEALKALPSSSSHLNSLKLQLKIKSDWDSESESGSLRFPWDKYSEVIMTINQLRFPVLTSLALSFGIAEECRNPSPVAVFSSFLREHPLLSDLTLSGSGMCTDAKGAHFPQLRVLTGLVEHCVPILVHAGEPEQLNLTISKELMYCSSEDSGTAKILQSDVGATIRRLNVGIAGKPDWQRFSPYLFSCLASAFPNVTQLDIQFTKQMSKYQDSFVTLPALEYLCIRKNKWIPEKNRTKATNIIFPTTAYAARINKILPSLPNLSTVDLILRGLRYTPEGDRGVPWCESCDQMWSEVTYPTLEVDLRFSVDRTGESGLQEAEVVLVAREVDNQVAPMSWMAIDEDSD
ncbi:hypothetical protein GGX14DRAFT_451506 [Mycena pura]|uniref:Uncharacterized protein n=1 Tax=Mycena pura TaxID=153505 RepID=A0AAD6YBM6_9AGAR|nr:hypothetical protein GGX14DRAFT_451506 [Mycena pura]